MINFKGRVNQIIFQTLAVQSLEIGISFLRNLMLIRYVGGEAYGKYQYLIAALALLDLSVLNLDNIIRRFLAEADVEQKKTIIRSNLIVKYSFFALVAFGLSFFRESLGSQYTIIFLLGFYFLTSSLLNTFVAIAQGMEVFSEINRFSSLNSILSFLAIAVAYFLFNMSPESFLILHIIVNILMALANLYLISRLVFRRNFEIFKAPQGLGLIETLNQGIWQYRAYHLPAMMSGPAGYLKTYVPSILMGRLGMFESVAYYEIVKKIYGILHKFVPKTVRSMTATVVRKKQSPEFVKKWTNYNLNYILLMILIGIGMYALSPLVMGLYKVEFNSDVQFLFFVFSFYLTVGAWGQAIEFLVNASSSTMGIFYSALGRQIYFIVAYALVFESASVKSLSIILILASLTSLVQMLFWLYRNEKRFILLQFKCLALIAVQFMVMVIFYHYDLYWNSGDFLRSFRW